jgi:uncharacterized protein YndB with AHSA1/START domain
MGVFGDWAWEACESDLRVDGRWRYAWKQTGGDARLVLSGVYREIVRHERIVRTQVYEGMDEFSEMLVTAVFREAGGKTTLEMTVEYATRQERDADLKAMPSGLEPGFAMLDELLATLT